MLFLIAEAVKCREMPLLKLGAFLQSKITSTRKCFPFIPTAQKVYPASGRRSSKRAPVDDMGNNRLPSNKTGVLGLGSPTTNSPVVVCAPEYGFHPLLWPSREWRPCLFPSLQFPIMAELVPLLTLPLLRVLCRCNLLMHIHVECLLAFISSQPHPHQASS